MKRLAMALVAASAAWAQLSMQQRADDFNYLAGVLNRNYAAYEWKRQAFGFDMLDTKPWIEKARGARDDFEFYDICIEYAAGLRDYYTYLQLPSDYFAYLGFSADLYDGKAIVDDVSGQAAGIALGDEIISIDGAPIAALIREYGKYAGESNPRSNDRVALDAITARQQAYIPRAASIGETASVVLRKADGGGMVTVEAPWTKSGTPMLAGPVPDFGASPKLAAGRASYERILERIDRPMAGRTARATAETGPPEAVAIGGLAPLYALPAGFQTRLGRARADLLYSGSFQSSGKRIGLLRIPNATSSAAFNAQLDAEVVWLRDNTDVLVLDVMHDRMTTICGHERAAARFIGRPFTQPGFAYRATWANLLLFEDALASAIDEGAPAETVGYLGDFVRALRAGYEQNRGMTGALPVCGIDLANRPPATDRLGNVVAYAKPILLVVDEFSSDLLPAILQDEGRAKLFGMRTRGTLGLSLAASGSAFTETVIYVKDAVMVRSRVVKSPGYPETNLVDSVGVHPEIVEDFMTVDNFHRKGAAFVEAFTKAALDLVP